MRGGARPGAGRKPGSKGQRTVERLKQVEAVIAAANDTVPNAFEGDSHAFLVSVYRNPGLDIHLRIDAAKAAIGYEKPKLAAVTHAGDKDKPLPHEVRWHIVWGEPKPEDEAATVVNTGVPREAAG